LSRLRAQEIFIDTPLEALRKLEFEGFEEVIVQPLHIIPGMEYERILKTVEQFKDKFKTISVGKPLLYEEKDFIAAVDALKSHLPKDGNQQAYALMGHGSSHMAQEYYSRLQRYIDLGGIKAYVGTIKGAPGIRQIVEGLKRDNIRNVILAPFMLVAGNHALIDMASEEEGSWKSILIKEGFNVEIYLRGIGENKEYQKIYIHKVRETIEKTRGGVYGDCSHRAES
jgi:sirohydrochlorin cobaltochelatase